MILCLCLLQSLFSEPLPGNPREPVAAENPGHETEEHTRSDDVSRPLFCSRTRETAWKTEPEKENESSTEAEVLLDEDAPREQRLAILRKIGEAPRPLDLSVWREALAVCLDGTDEEILIRTCRVIRNRNLDWFDHRLLQIGGHCCTPTTVRIEALNAVVDRAETMDPLSFLVLKSQLYRQVPLDARLKGAFILGRAPLSCDQLLKLLEEILSEAPVEADPLVWPLIFPAFGRCAGPEVGEKLAQALEAKPGIENIPDDILDRVLTRYPESVEIRIRTLRAEAVSEADNLQARIFGETGLSRGDPEKGRQLFFSNRTGCSFCHGDTRGKETVGPGLAEIHRKLEAEEIYESILFPDRHVSRAYETCEVVLNDDRVFTGILAGDATRTVTLVTPVEGDLTFPKHEVREIRTRPVSLMPKGMGRVLSATGISDLAAFLKELE